MRKRRNPSFWLYVIGFYVLAQFFWWAWLLIDQSAEIVNLSVEGDPEAAIRRRIFMVLGEGVVFVVLLIFGFKQLRDSVQKQLNLAHTQRNFLLSITHELNTPLASILLYSQTLKRRELENDQRMDLLDKSIAETHRLKGLVDNLLTSTRIEENQLVLHPEVQELAPIIKSIANGLQEKHGASLLHLDLNESVMASVDPLALESIVQNLIENAFKYSPEGNPVYVSLQTSDEGVIIAVKDEGIGIDEGQEEAIFDKFYRVQSEATRTTKGTGLGLYIVSSLCKMLNGRIDYQKNQPKGSIFIVKLPLSQ